MVILRLQNKMLLFGMALIYTQGYLTKINKYKPGIVYIIISLYYPKRKQNIFMNFIVYEKNVAINAIYKVL